VIDETTARETIRHAARLVREGDSYSATRALMSAWVTCLVSSGPAPLVHGGAELCALALKAQLTVPLPTDVDVFYAMRLSNGDGHNLSFEDASADPAELAALQCVSASLNGDHPMVASILSAYIGRHGSARTLELVTELLKFLVAFDYNGVVSNDEQ
jgi:hypothetical protein